MRKISRGRVLAGAGAISPVVDTSVSIVVGALVQAGQATAGTAINVAVTGAALGDSVVVFPPAAMQGLLHSASVPAAGSVALALVNTTPGTVTLGTATWGVQLYRRT